MNPQPNTRLHRVQLNLSPVAHAELVDLAERSGRTLSTVIREALALAYWWEREQRSGARILVERAGTAQEVVLR